MKKLMRLGIGTLLLVMVFSVGAAANSIFIDAGARLWNDNQLKFEGMLTVGYNHQIDYDLDLDVYTTLNLSPERFGGRIGSTLRMQVIDTGLFKTKIVLDYNVGAGLQSDIWKYRSFAVGVDNALMFSNFQIDNWLLAGVKDESALTFGKLDDKFYRIGLGFSMADFRLGGQVQLEQAAPESERSLETRFDLRVGYSFNL